LGKLMYDPAGGTLDLGAGHPEHGLDHAPDLQIG
jgi:hypothetical protein